MQSKKALALISLIGLFITSVQAQAFIRRRYRLEEVVKESSNIVFGTVLEVNQKRMTAKVRIDENLKGKSDFEEIKVNIAVGQGDFPQQLIKQFRVGLPIIIFYKKDGRRLMSLGHINGTWFQTFASDQSDKSRVWWNMTHIEIYMHRTYDGTTPDFQKRLREVMASKPEPKASKDLKVQKLALAPSGAIRVLVLTSNRSKREFNVLSRFHRSAGKQVVYQKTRDRNLPDLEHADLLWIGHREIRADKYFLTPEQENRIKAFSKNGGIVIVSGQDSDAGRPCATGWLPEPLEGVERSRHRSFQPTRAAGSIFSKPNEIKSKKAAFDDTWTAWNDKFKVLATTNGGKDIAIAMLKYGKGMYLITSFKNESKANISANRLLMENLIHFAVKWLN